MTVSLPLEGPLNVLAAYTRTGHWACSQTPTVRKVHDGTGFPQVAVCVSTEQIVSLLSSSMKEL